MTKEEKELLHKDLCARLPYDVIISTKRGNEFLVSIECGESFINKDIIVKTPIFHTEQYGGTRYVNDIDEIKPYLRPMSSITDEEKEHCGDLILHAEDWISYYDYLDSRYLDYRGLIEKGLALEAKEGMYKNE